MRRLKEFVRKGIKLGKHVRMIRKKQHIRKDNEILTREALRTEELGRMITKGCDKSITVRLLDRS